MLVLLLPTQLDVYHGLKLKHKNMKLIQEISIWDNGVIKKGSILNTYAINLLLNQSATFYYSINSINENGSYGQMLAQGNILMTGKDYENWEGDNYAWQFIAKSLNLVIVGDYVDPVAEQPIQ